MKADYTVSADGKVIQNLDFTNETYRRRNTTYRERIVLQSTFYTIQAISDYLYMRKYTPELAHIAPAKEFLYLAQMSIRELEDYAGRLKHALFEFGFA